MLLPVKILGTGEALPAARVPTREVLQEAMPDRDAEALEQRLGIHWRGWQEGERGATRLGAAALAAALEDAGLEGRDLERLLFVSSTGGDWLIPATANAVAAELGLSDHCGVFDLNNACTGFLSAFDLGARLCATGESPVAIVASEVFSPHISPTSPRSYVVMGDVAAACVLGTGEGPPSGETGPALLASVLGNDGSLLEAATLEQAGLTGRPELLEFGVDGSTIGRYALTDLVRSSDEALAAAGLGREDVTWFLPHQPNGAMLDIFLDRMGYEEERTLRVVDEIGSTGAASVPVSLHRLKASGRLSRGDIVLLAAVGGGTSRGGIVLRI